MKDEDQSRGIKLGRLSSVAPWPSVGEARLLFPAMDLNGAGGTVSIGKFDHPASSVPSAPGAKGRVCSAWEGGLGPPQLSAPPSTFISCCPRRELVVVGPPDRLLRLWGGMAVHPQAQYRSHLSCILETAPTPRWGLWMGPFPLFKGLSSPVGC